MGVMKRAVSPLRRGSAFGRDDGLGFAGAFPDLTLALFNRSLWGQGLFGLVRVSSDWFGSISLTSSHAIAANFPSRGRAGSFQSSRGNRMVAVGFLSPVSP